MNEYIEIMPIDDGLTLRESGLWVAEKLCFIEKYLHAFTQSMGAKDWRNIRYIDMFAGPGKCLVRARNQVLLGSPLLALSVKRKFTDYVFVDNDSHNIDCLKKRTQSFLNSVRISYEVGDSNKKVKRIVGEILDQDENYLPGRWPSLNLAFLDPEGLELEWDTVVELARARTDLIIHYSQFGITRNIEKCAQLSEDTAIDHFFGSRDWRIIYGKHHRAPGEVHSKLLELYHSNLTALGYVDINEIGDHLDPLMKTSQTKAPLYRLIFASKHRLGHKLWAAVTKEDAYGQKRLF